jgi:hypothetical protein
VSSTARVTASSWHAELYPPGVRQPNRINPVQVPVGDDGTDGDEGGADDDGGGGNELTGGLLCDGNPVVMLKVGTGRSLLDGAE